MRPAHVTVYGNDHSPWVQAVLLGLDEADIPWTLVAAPPPGLLFEHASGLNEEASVDGFVGNLHLLVAWISPLQPP
jgi:hypothetical protein